MQLECRLPVGQHSHDSAPSPLIYLPISVLLTLNPPSGCILSADRKRTKIEGCGRSKVIFRGRFDWFSASSRTACDCAVILTSVEPSPATSGLHSKKRPAPYIVCIHHPHYLHYTAILYRLGNRSCLYAQRISSRRYGRSVGLVVANFVPAPSPVLRRINKREARVVNFLSATLLSPLVLSHGTAGQVWWFG